MKGHEYLAVLHVTMNNSTINQSVNQACNLSINLSIDFTNIDVNSSSAYIREKRITNQANVEKRLNIHEDNS